MSRYQAAAIHLALSASIVGLALTTVLFLWYPGAWFESMGGKHLLFILAGVDVILGPLLTLIVFRSGKKSLKFDLGVIVLLQLSAFLYGIQVIFAARPAYMVLVVDQFRAVTAVELEPELLQTARYPEFRTLPLDGPRIAGSALPTDPAKRDAVTWMSVTQGIDLHQLPEYWEPYAGEKALRIAGSMQSLREIDPANGPVIDAAIASRSLNAEQLRFVPLRTRKKEMAVLIDATSGTVVDIIDAKPWR
jgi:hypothetical protein